MHAAIVKAHPEAYQTQADFRIDAVNLRDEIISPARTILLVLLAASALVFIVACSNVANLILARSVRREGELAVRAALGAGTGALATDAPRREPAALRRRRGARDRHRAADGGRARALRGALFGARQRRDGGREPALGRRRARGGGGRAARVRAAPAIGRVGERSGPVERQACGSRRARIAACACSRSRRSRASFVLLAGAGMLITTLFALQRQQTGFRGNVLAVNVPVVSYTRKPEEIAAFYREAIRRISELPGVEQVALGTVVPWRDPGFFAAQFTAEGYRKANGEEDPRAQFRTVSPGFFSALGVPIIAGRDFNDGDRRDGEKVVIVSQSLAQRMFPNMDAVNRRMMWTDPVTKFIGVSTDRETHRRRRRRRGRREPRAEPVDDGVSPDGAGDQRRPAVRPREDGSVSAGSDDHEGHPRVSRRISRWSARRRWTMCARKCWRRIASTRSCSADSPASRSRSRWSASPACWRSR